MRRRVERQGEAFRRALMFARMHGVGINNIVPKVEKVDKRLKQITGYYIIDETGSTTVATVMI